MKRRLWIQAVVFLSLFALNGCGSSENYFDEREVTYYLQTYDDTVGVYEGVADIYYECGRDIVGYTDSRGAFTFREDDKCTFYDLDDTVSYEYDRLYISASSNGSYAVGDLAYECASGWEGITDTEGMFIFDPDYFNSVSDGDICSLYF